MTTPDQPGNQPLTRKQLREMRLTGATPVISDAMAAPPVTPAPVVQTPVEAAPVAPAVQATVREAPAEAASRNPFSRRRPRIEDSYSSPITQDNLPSRVADENEGVDDSATAVNPRSAAFAVDVPTGNYFETPTTAPQQVPLQQPYVPETPETPTATAPQHVDDSSGASTATPRFEDAVARPTVNPAFGQDILDENPPVAPAASSFDELITTDSGGSHRAPNTLIFTPSANEGSLSGPVASTGEVLVTGSYDLPAGIGSHGHAHGTTDGKDVDAVLIDGELPPASSPTPIAASAAVSTIKPAGEVIRPPAPEKGNKLMLILAITAGGLALALAVALIFAFTTNVI
ncbi:hypothetical protein [uncultured Microbacterium sp.]|uniref:hypothetical protein n=1 Tax=uncultured Microbacterium sp. TaxID=191216 RepID=UPI00262F22BF|nr:hypothetical protein [uncultured Microbacterium sp.]